MKKSRIFICTLALIFCVFAAAMSISAAVSVPKISILALNLTLDLVLVVSAAAIVTAAVCIGLKFYKRNQKLHK